MFYLETFENIRMFDEEEFTAFENKVDEVMQILNLMSCDEEEQSNEGIEASNKLANVEYSSSHI